MITFFNKLNTVAILLLSIALPHLVHSKVMKLIQTILN